MGARKKTPDDDDDARGLCASLRLGSLSALPALEALAPTSSVAKAALAQVALFQGDLVGAAALATGYLAAPPKRGSLDTFVVVCRIVRHAARALGRSSLVDDAVAVARADGDYSEPMINTLRSSVDEIALVEAATAVAASDAGETFAAVLAGSKKAAGQKGEDNRFAFEVSLASTLHLDDELLRRFAERPALFSWEARKDVAFAFMRRDEAPNAVAAVDVDGCWRALDACLIVPGELATHPVFSTLFTTARGEAWLHRSR